MSCSFFFLLTLLLHEVDVRWGSVLMWLNPTGHGCTGLCIICRVGPSFSFWENSYNGITVLPFYLSRLHTQTVSVTRRTSSLNDIHTNWWMDDPFLINGERTTVLSHWEMTMCIFYEETREREEYCYICGERDAIHFSRRWQCRFLQEIWMQIFLCARRGKVSPSYSRNEFKAPLAFSK